MKTYVLILSEHFPKNHPQAGEPTHFIDGILSGDKLHTIRGNYDLWSKRIDEVNRREAVLSVRKWTGKPYKSKQEVICILTELDYELLFMTNYIGRIEITVEDSYLYDPEMNALGKNDGLINRKGLEDWFLSSSKEIDSQTFIIIHFPQTANHHVRYGSNHRQ